MGCTSSAPNMVNSSTAEKTLHFEEEMSDDQSKDTDEIIYRAEENNANETTEVPSRDTLAEPTHIIRNRSTPSLKTEKDTEDKEISNKNLNTADLSNIKEEKNVQKLEEVVGKVVELNSSEKVDDRPPVIKRIEELKRNEENKDSGEGNNNVENIDQSEIEQDKEKDISEEASSPSQSESSRATRWEALADIAAELPPSLTVDPLTGQIYALSK